MSRHKRPSPALVISILALVAAMVVPAYAALNKKDKKTVRNIANTEITKRAPGLAVASANNANTANSANTAASASTAANGIDGVAGGITSNTGNDVLLFSLAEGSISVFCDDVVADFKYTNNSGAPAQVFDDGAFSALANGATDVGREGDLMIATDDHLINAHLQIQPSGSDCPFAASFYEIAL